MKILLDTHTLIWALGAPEKMPEYIVEMICNENNDIYVSAASLWEISIKNKKSPEKMPFTATQIRDYCQRAGYYFLSLSIDSVATFDKLNWHLKTITIRLTKSLLVNQSLTTWDLLPMTKKLNNLALATLNSSNFLFD